MLVVGHSAEKNAAIVHQIKQQTGNLAIVGGAVIGSETNGQYSKTLTTAAPTDWSCFTDVPEGNYNISAAIPDNYNSTTNPSATISVKVGDLVNVPFGCRLAPLRRCRHLPL